MIELERQHWTL